jgi:putative SOS response-associated peptidase YedK
MHAERAGRIRQKSMTAYPVSTVVNNPRNETKECVEAVK